MGEAQSLGSALFTEMDSPKWLGNWTEPHPQAPLGATFHHRSYLLVSWGQRCCLLALPVLVP